MRKLTPIALLATAVTALYWKRRAIQAENRLTARVLADEREKAERAAAGKGFWDLFFSDETKPVSSEFQAAVDNLDCDLFSPVTDDPSATKPNLSEVLQGVKEASSRGWAHTVGSDLTAEELTHGGKELGGVVPDAPEGQKLKLARCSMSVYLPKEIADEISRSADEYLGKLNKAGGDSDE